MRYNCPVKILARECFDFKGKGYRLDVSLPYDVVFIFDYYKINRMIDTFAVISTKTKAVGLIYSSLLRIH